MKDLIHELDLRKSLADHPVLVHCSAGIGRTGTFLAIHMSLQKDLRGHEIDIRDTVRHLRTQRLGMVQSKEQYMFVYAVVAEMLKEKDEVYSLKHHHKHSVKHRFGAESERRKRSPKTPRSTTGGNLILTHSDAPPALTASASPPTSTRTHGRGYSVATPTSKPKKTSASPSSSSPSFSLDFPGGGRGRFDSQPTLPSASSFSSSPPSNRSKKGREEVRVGGTDSGRNGRQKTARKVLMQSALSRFVDLQRRIHDEKEKVKEEEERVREKLQEGGEGDKGGEGEGGEGGATLSVPSLSSDGESMSGSLRGSGGDRATMSSSGGDGVSTSASRGGSTTPLVALRKTDSVPNLNSHANAISLTPTSTSSSTSGRPSTLSTRTSLSMRRRAASLPPAMIAFPRPSSPTVNGGDDSNGGSDKRGEGEGGAGGEGGGGYFPGDSLAALTHKVVDKRDLVLSADEIHSNADMYS
eukprot:TRINITY_DN965_c0_g1_i1.p1 TRINITY_DN965_c0_g1~~TRINITY_DN965_c0_g1_i1.p1  ORF type:complete len:468 (+),score=110.01 TRINITY_DN965_c0_g1_i1:663-2066(+)